MEVPPEIAFRGITPTDELKARILDGIESLEDVYPNLISCRTMVADDTPDQQSGNNYRIRLEVGIPSKTLVVDRQNPEPDKRSTLEQTLNEAFAVARKRLVKAKKLQRGEVKKHELPPHGRIVRLLTDETGVRYGFLESRDGEQVYFHEEALVDLDYEDLDVGDEVRFAAAHGDDGLQASTVASLDPGAVGPSRERDVPLSGSR
ncbi:MAG: cold shock domain-containing protein [Longimicrobiales bacterium]|nr:cold shock domain-containing protein [Longimicrobiales bacterium]